MNVRAFKWTVAGLLCVTLLLAWRCFILYHQMVTTAFIHSQCETTQRAFIEGQSDPEVLASRLQFLMGYYKGYSRTLESSPVAKLVEDDYLKTLTNAVTALRHWTTNDLGNDPISWIRKYGR